MAIVLNQVREANFLWRILLQSKNSLWIWIWIICIENLNSNMNFHLSWTGVREYTVVQIPGENLNWIVRLQANLRIWGRAPRLLNCSKIEITLRTPSLGHRTSHSFQILNSITDSRVSQPMQEGSFVLFINRQTSPHPAFQSGPA